MIFHASHDSFGEIVPTDFFPDCAYENKIKIYKPLSRRFAVKGADQAVLRYVGDRAIKRKKQR